VYGAVSIAPAEGNKNLAPQAPKKSEGHVFGAVSLWEIAFPPPTGEWVLLQNTQGNIEPVKATLHSTLKGFQGLSCIPATGPEACNIGDPRDTVTRASGT